MRRRPAREPEQIGIFDAAQPYAQHPHGCRYVLTLNEEQVVALAALEMPDEVHETVCKFLDWQGEQRAGREAWEGLQHE